MNRGSVRRLAETIFRRWWLFTLPIVAMVAIGVTTVRSNDQEFRSTALLSVRSETLLGTLLDGGSGSFSWESPAQSMSREMNELLRTDDFVENVVGTAGIDTSLAGFATIQDARDAIWASARGEGLVSVTAATQDPVASHRLTEATIDAFVQSVIDSSVAQSLAAQDFLSELVEGYERDLNAANAEVDAFLLANPGGDGAQLSASEQIELDRLRTIASRAETRYDGAVRSIEDAELSVQRDMADAEQRLNVVDRPVVPAAPEPTLRRDVMVVGFFLVIGLLLSAVWVAVAAALDRTIRWGGDVGSRLDVELLGVVPYLPATPDVASGFDAPAAIDAPADGELVN